MRSGAEGMVEVVTVRGRPFLVPSEECDPTSLILLALRPVSDGDYEEAEAAFRGLIERQERAGTSVLGVEATVVALVNLSSIALLRDRPLEAAEAVAKADHLAGEAVSDVSQATLHLCAAHVEALEGTRERAALRLRSFRERRVDDPRLLVEWQLAESEVAELSGDLAYAAYCCAVAWKVARRHGLDVSLVERVNQRREKVVEHLQISCTGAATNDVED